MQICIFAFVLYCKRKPHANFHKIILIFEAPGVFENENFDALARAENLDLDFLNHAWPLVFWPVLSDQKKIPHSTLICSIVLQCFALLLTLINTAPFGTLITPGDVPIKMHTCCTFDVAHLYEAVRIRRPFVCFPTKFLETSRKRAT